MLFCMFKTFIFQLSKAGLWRLRIGLWLEQNTQLGSMCLGTACLQLWAQEVLIGHVYICEGCCICWRISAGGPFRRSPRHVEMKTHIG